LLVTVIHSFVSDFEGLPDSSSSRNAGLVLPPITLPGLRAILLPGLSLGVPGLPPGVGKADWRLGPPKGEAGRPEEKRAVGDEGACEPGGGPDPAHLRWVKVRVKME
jgi:hypothetical protein